MSVPWKPVTHGDFVTLEKVQANPYYHACFIIESGCNPLATTTQSTAQGAFQLIRSTRKALGVKDGLDFTENFRGFVKLTEQNMKAFRTNDPLVLYSAHYLGATLLRRYKKGEKLSVNQKDIVDTFFKKILPRFKKIYEQLTKT